MSQSYLYFRKITLIIQTAFWKIMCSEKGWMLSPFQWIRWVVKTAKISQTWKKWWGGVRVERWHFWTWWMTGWENKAKEAGLSRLSLASFSWFRWGWSITKSASQESREEYCPFTYWAATVFKVLTIQQWIKQTRLLASCLHAIGKKRSAILIASYR